MKENQRLEWKETWRDEFIRWICGFANADGGVLHIGRNDRGTVVGVPDAGSPKPKLILDGTGIALEFRYTPEYLKAVNALDPVTPEVTDPVTDPVKRVLLLLAQGELAPSAIQKAIGLSHRPTFRQNYLRAAENAGLIERTLPDKPNSRLQKYRLTAGAERGSPSIRINPMNEHPTSTAALHRAVPGQFFSRMEVPAGHWFIGENELANTAP